MSNRTTLPNHPFGDWDSVFPGEPVVRNSGPSSYRYWDLSKFPEPVDFPGEVPEWARHWASARCFYVLDDFGAPLVLTSRLLVSLMHAGISVLRTKCLEPLPLEESSVISLQPHPEAFMPHAPIGTNLNSLSEMLLWLLCFPSAKRSWANVYLNNLRGVQAMPLPRAVVHVRLTSGVLFGVRIATRLWLDAVVPTEAPFPAYKALDGRMFQIRTPPSRASAGKESQLKRADGSTDCSDEEWESVRRIVISTKTSHAKARDGRQMFDLLLYRLSHGLPISMLPASVNNASRVYMLELALRRSGKLDNLITRLVEARTQSR